MKVSIIVSFQFEGFHCWEKAPNEHSYLRHTHRHMFHVRAKKTVQALDREIEFIALKREMEGWTKGEFGSYTVNGQLKPNAHGASCEAMAKDLLMQFNLDSVEVLEDGENGAEVCR